MDDFKIRVNNYLSKFIKGKSGLGFRCEVKYENYSESDISYQCNVFIKSQLFFILEFIMLKDKCVELNVDQISLTNQHVKILTSFSDS